MHRKVQLSIALLFALATIPSTATPRPRNLEKRSSLSSLLPRTPQAADKTLEKRVQQGSFDVNPDGSTFLWVIEDTYDGHTFFDGFNFFPEADPTHGTVNYLSRNDAFNQSLAYVTPNNKVILKGDNTTWLPAGQFRDSVRVSSQAQYNTGLFILDLDKAPWGCAVWPAFWTIGSGQWPYTGEIDIIEGVHDNEHNQVTWHTGPGCTLNPKANFTGSIVDLDCDGTLPGNPGCGITEWSRASYGPSFDAQGGGVFAMKWDESGVAVWSFYRAAVPQDIVRGEPNPSLWGVPSAALDPAQCDPMKYFVNHSIIFDITFCGDWAGNSYATSGCPGTCADRLMNPQNFDNATWIINSLQVYGKRNISGKISSSATADRSYVDEHRRYVLWGLVLLSIGFLGGV